MLSQPVDSPRIESSGDTNSTEVPKPTDPWNIPPDGPGDRFAVSDAISLCQWTLEKLKFETDLINVREKRFYLYTVGALAIIGLTSQGQLKGVFEAFPEITLSRLLSIVSFVGCLGALVTIRAIYAAHKQIDRIQDYWESKNPKWVKDLCGPLYGEKSQWKVGRFQSYFWPTIGGLLYLSLMLLSMWPTISALIATKLHF